MRSFPGSWLAIILSMMGPSQAEPPVALRAAGPNVLIIVGDDHAGGTLGIDGDPREATPNLDRLARSGVRFDRAYCNAPVCTPSRQSFLTGRLPHAVGVTLLKTPLPEEAITLGDWFSERGYQTGAIGKMHFNGPSRHGFAERIDTPDWHRHLKAHPPEGGDHRRPWRPFRDPAAVWLNSEARNFGLPAASMEATFLADRAIAFLDRHQADRFALVVGFHEPHSPFRFPRGWDNNFSPEQFDAPPISDFDRTQQPLIFRDLTPAQVRGIQVAYYTSLSFLDQQVGRILDALDAKGLADDTIVVYLSDNGYLLGHHGRFEKHVLYEPAVRVPLIVRWPGRLPAGRRVTEMVELVDVLPTLLDLCGLPHPPDLHGRGLVPLLKGEPGAKGREFVFSEYLENEEAMVRSGRYKLIVGTGRRRRQDGYVTADPTPGPYERLYDLEADPDEMTDVSDRPGLTNVVSELRVSLHHRLTSTREGLPPVPAGRTLVEAIHWCLIPRDEGTDPGGITPDRSKH